MTAAYDRVPTTPGTCVGASGPISGGTVFTIIDNTSASAVSGTFNGLAEGSTVTVGLNQCQISYVGGTGNDVTLTVVGAAAPQRESWAAHLP